MENFKRSGFRGGGARGSRDDFKRSFTKSNNRGNDRDARPITMHSAVCASCGKSCEVPFRPNGDKPVYCRDCFAGQAAMGGERSNRKDYRKEGRTLATPAQSIGNDSGVKKQLEEISMKLDKLIAVIQNQSKN